MDISSSVGVLLAECTQFFDTLVDARGADTHSVHEESYAGNKSASTSSQIIWPIKLCVSWIRWVSSLGTISARSQSAAIRPPSRPSKPMTVTPCLCACSHANATFGDCPEVEMAKHASPLTPRAS